MKQKKNVTKKKYFNKKLFFLTSISVFLILDFLLAKEFPSKNLLLSGLTGFGVASLFFLVFYNKKSTQSSQQPSLQKDPLYRSIQTIQHDLKKLTKQLSKTQKPDFDHPFANDPLLDIFFIASTRDDEAYIFKSYSRTAKLIAPNVSGSSHSPSPIKQNTRGSDSGLIIPLAIKYRLNRA